MAAPYYGSPDSFRAYNKNIKRLTTLDPAAFAAEVELFDGVVRPKMEADLYEVFETLPTPDSTQKNVLSVLWLYGMTDELQESEGATARNAQSGYAERQLSKYEKLLEKIKSGAMLVPGAVRGSGLPKSRDFTLPRVTMSERDEPLVIADQFPHGLRR